MKYTSTLKHLLLPALLLISILTGAHPGGHFHKGDGTVLNTWQLKNGQSVKGNFSMGKADYILLEQEEGKMLKVAIADLAPQDQLLAKFKIKKFERLNEAYNIQPLSTTSTVKVWNYNYLLLSVLLTVLIGILLLAGFKLVQKTDHGLQRMIAAGGYLILIALSTFACKKSSDNITTTVSTSIPKTSISFLDNAFAPYKPSISTSSDANYYYVAAGGFPAHNMMVGIVSWQQQVPIPQFYAGSNSWSIPLQPEYATVPLSTKTNLMKGAVAIAVNGIPIFNALNNRGVDSYATGELDNWGGHCGRADDYHYHAAPLHLSATSGLKPIAFALDGFAVYGNLEPDGSAMQALDTCHGHVIGNGVYHYHGTTTYPYVVGAMKGKVTLDPATPAPENQILPQAFASPVRPALTPLNGATIIAFQSAGVNAYKLTYQRGTKLGYVEYSWDAANKYIYKLTDTSGAVTTTVYQR